MKARPLMTKMTITETRPVEQDEIFEWWRLLAQEVKALIGLLGMLDCLQSKKKYLGRKTAAS